MLLLNPRIPYNLLKNISPFTSYVILTVGKTTVSIIYEKNDIFIKIQETVDFAIYVATFILYFLNKNQISLKKFRSERHNELLIYLQKINAL